MQVPTGHIKQVSFAEVEQVRVFAAIETGKVAKAVSQRLEPVRRLQHEPAKRFAVVNKRFRGTVR